MRLHYHKSIQHSFIDWGNRRLRARIWEHKTKFYPKSFTSKYNCDKVVWYESFSRIEEAIVREKQIKGGSRKDKEALIKSANPTWKDLRESIQDL